MRSRRWTTALVGLLGSLLLSAVAWVYFDTALLFLLVPFVPVLLGRGADRDPESSPRECPRCGFRSAEPAHEYCPRDGTRLER